jgi:hypothetical protein
MALRCRERAPSTTSQTCLPRCRRRLGGLRLEARHASATAIGYRSSRGVSDARREFIAWLSCAAAAWPLAARAQRPALPVVGFCKGGSANGSAIYAVAFRRVSAKTNYVEGQNVTVEYHWHRIRCVAAKAASATIPIVFGVGDDPGQAWSCRLCPRSTPCHPRTVGAH